MKILDFLKGRTILVKTEVGVEVELEIDRIVENKHSVDLEKGTPANDWWPQSREWSTYTAYFTNGHSKVYNSLQDIDLKSL